MLHDVHCHVQLLTSVQLLGRCIKDLPREEVFVATKVGKYIPGEDEDFSADRVTKSVHESLKRLQLDYIDLIHCHDIESAKDMKQVKLVPHKAKEATCRILT